jgi:hypothetical protein
VSLFTKFTTLPARRKLPDPATGKNRWIFASREGFPASIRREREFIVDIQRRFLLHSLCGVTGKLLHTTAEFPTRILS